MLQILLIMLFQISPKKSLIVLIIILFMPLIVITIP